MTLDLPRALERFREDGFGILEGGLDREALAQLTAALAPHEEGRPRGRNDFEGEASTRIYSLAGKGEAFRQLAEHPWIMAMCDALLLPNFLLSTMQSIRLHPGETAQAFHTDDAFYVVPRPRTATLAVSVIWAIEDFTERNGATEVIPGSHRWGAEHPDRRAHDVVRATMPAGSALVFSGATWHRGGESRAEVTRLAISPQYNQPYLRPQESQLLIVPVEAARECSDRVRSMLGYSIHPPFIGQVDGMHPLRLVDPSYRAHKTHDREIADRFLSKPQSVVDDGS